MRGRGSAFLGHVAHENRGQSSCANFLPGTKCCACLEACAGGVRAEEKTWPRDRVESEVAFEARLERTARSIPAAAIKKALGDMKRRCKSVIANEGDWVTGD